LRLTVWSQLAGLGLLVPALLVVHETMTMADTWRGIAAGFGSGLSLLALYHSCARMSPGLASATAGAVTALLALVVVVISAQTVSLLVVLGLGPCVAGVALISASNGEDAPGRVRPWAMVEAVASGAFMAVYYFALAGSGAPVYAVLMARIAALSLLMTLTPRMTARPAGPARSSTASYVSVGISGAAGTLAYGVAATQADILMLVAIASCAPAVTAALSHLRFGEVLSRLQIVGLSACVVGAAAASASSL
jgi:drug/metabolite transporter (DMT)-like permease